MLMLVIHKIYVGKVGSGSTSSVYTTDKQASLYVSTLSLKDSPDVEDNVTVFEEGSQKLI